MREQAAGLRDAGARQDKNKVERSVESENPRVVSTRKPRSGSGESGGVCPPLTSVELEGFKLGELSWGVTGIIRNPQLECAVGSVHGP